MGGQEQSITAVIFEGFLCFSLSMGTIVGAAILRAAIALYNKIISGSVCPNRVPELSIWKALPIPFVTSLVTAGVGYVVGVLTGIQLRGVAQGFGLQGDKAQALADFVSIATGVPAGLLAMAVMLPAMAPTSFGRGIIVSLLWLIISIVLWGGIAFVMTLAYRLLILH